MVPELVRSWVAGWVISRGSPPVTEELWGYRIDVGLEHQRVRFVVPDPVADDVRKLADTVTEPATWIKAPVEAAEITPWLGPEWMVDTPGFLMSTELHSGRPSSPDGYSLTSETADGITKVRVLTTDREPAAWGQVAPTGATAVFDQIQTAGAHRRRGLGSLVMRALSGAAADQGATVGILATTCDGQSLYRSLGWHTHAPMSGFIHHPS